MLVEHHPGLLRLSLTGRRIVTAIRSAGGRPYLVGGCVRDALLHPDAAPKDVDLEVYGLTLPTLTRALRTVGSVDEVGRAFSVLKMRGPGGDDFDIALPRTETKTADGHRGFTVTPDPHADPQVASARRDLTINALMFDPVTETIHDHHGGLADLRAGILRHTSPAFGEDPLRVLRTAGFAARLEFTVHPDTLRLASTLAHTFEQLSRERVWVEWHKIVSRGSLPSAAVHVLEQTGWLTHFPELANLAGVPQEPTWHPEGDVLTHSRLAADKAAELADDANLTGDDRAVVVLAALLHDVGKTTHTQHTIVDGRERITSQGHAEAGVAIARDFLTRIGTPAHMHARILPLVAEHMTGTRMPTPTPAAVRRLTRRLTPATLAEWAIVVEADKGGRGTGSMPGGTEHWLRLAEQMNATKPAPRLLNGDHLINAGLRPGPQFGPILAAALAAQDDGDITDEASAVAWLHEHLHANAPQRWPAQS